MSNIKALIKIQTHSCLNTNIDNKTDRISIIRSQIYNAMIILLISVYYYFYCDIIGNINDDLIRGLNDTKVYREEI